MAWYTVELTIVHKRLVSMSKKQKGKFDLLTVQYCGNGSLWQVRVRTAGGAITVLLFK